MLRIFDQVKSNDVATMQKGAARGGYVCECSIAGMSERYWSSAKATLGDCRAYCNVQCQELEDKSIYSYVSAEARCDYDPTA